MPYAAGFPDVPILIYYITYGLYFSGFSDFKKTACGYCSRAMKLLIGVWDYAQNQRRIFV